MENNNVKKLVDFIEKNPKYVKKPKTYISMRDLCYCCNGHSFNYVDRIRMTKEEIKRGYAPCQGRCPHCGTTEFTFVIRK